MNVKKTIKKIAALGAGVSMVGATLMGAFAYDLANYPTPFVQDGVFSGTIVIGEKAATADVLGAIDIAASLQADSVAKKAVDIPGVAGEVNLQGDSFKFKTSSDLLELREPVSDVYDTLTDNEVDALKGGEITTDEGSTDYNQYVRFGAGSTGLGEMGVNYLKDDDDNLADFLVVDDNNPFFEWEIEFTEGLESAIDTGDNSLSDIEDESINIFGTDYTIVKATIDDGSTGNIDLTLMSGDVSSTIREGETKTYTIDGVSYDVTLIFVSDPSGSSNDPEAKFMVNGEVTDSMKDGDTDTLSGDIQIGIRDLLVNSRDGVVEFFLGANKVELTDSDYTNSAFDGKLEVNNENIEDGDLDIRADKIGTTKAEITSIKYRLTADAAVGSTLYVPAGHGVREYLDEPQGMLSPSFDIKYEGLDDVQRADVKLDAQGDDNYDFVATNLRGDEYSFPFFTNEDNVYKFGDNDDEFIFVEASSTGDYNIGDDDYFVVSENAVGSATEKDDSAVLRYTDIDTSENLLYFEDQSTGDQVSLTYDNGTSACSGITDCLGVANNFVVAGHTYTVWVDNSTDHNIAVDLDGDGTLDSDRVGFTALGGATIDFAESFADEDNAVIYPGNAAGNYSTIVGNGATIDGTTWYNASGNTTSPTQIRVNMQMTTPSAQFDESPSNDETLSWYVYNDDADQQVHLRLPSSSYVGVNENSANEYSKYKVENDEENDDYDRSMTDYGAKVEYYNPSGNTDAEELTISVPEEQVGAQVFVTSGTVTKEDNAGVTSEVVNPIAVGLAVLDVDAPAIGTDNLIVVGGPNANTVAYELMGEPSQEEISNTFSPGKALIKSWDNNEKVSILVAGYEAIETQGASRVLANYGDYALSGDEVEVVVAGLNDLTVQAVGTTTVDTTTVDTTTDGNMTE